MDRVNLGWLSIVGLGFFFFCWCVLSKRARDVAGVGVQSHRLPSPPLEITLLV